MFSVFFEHPSNTWRNLWQLSLVLHVHMYIHTCAPIWTTLVSSIHFSYVIFPGYCFPFRILIHLWNVLSESKCSAQFRAQSSQHVLSSVPHSASLFQTLGSAGPLHVCPTILPAAHWPSALTVNAMFLPTLSSLSYPILPLPQSKLDMASSWLTISRTHNFSFTWLPESLFLPQIAVHLLGKTKQNKNQHFSYPSSLQSKLWALGTAFEVLGDLTLSCSLGFFVLNTLTFSSDSNISHVLPGCKILQYFNAFSIKP